MTEVFRIRAVKALTAVLERAVFVSSAGEEIQMTDRVFRGRIRYGEGDPIPMVSILEPPIPEPSKMGTNTAPYVTTPWVLLIQGFAPDDVNHPSDPANALLAEIKRVLVEEKQRGRGNEIFDLGPSRRSPNSILEMDIGSGAARPPDELSDVAYCWLTLTLKIAEDLSAPHL